MLLDCSKQAEVGQRMLLAWVSFLALPTPRCVSSTLRSDSLCAFWAYRHLSFLCPLLGCKY